MKKQTESDLVAEAVAYMRLHFARPLKLTKVARQIHILSDYSILRWAADKPGLP